MKRRYSDDERATALAALAANGGGLPLTARQLGIPCRTLRGWRDGTRHPEAAQMSVEKKRDMAAELMAVAWKLLDAIEAKIPDAPLNQTATAMGIAIDKARLLLEQPTEIVKSDGSVKHSFDPVHPDALRGFAADVAAAGLGGVPEDGCGEPVGGAEAAPAAAAVPAAQPHA